MCGIKEKHIGGLVGLVPIIVYYQNEPERAREAAMEHLSLTHLGPKMEAAGSLLVELLLKILGGMPLKEALLEGMGKSNNPIFSYPFNKWLEEPDDRVVGIDGKPRIDFCPLLIPGLPWSFLANDRKMKRQQHTPGCAG